MPRRRFLTWITAGANAVIVLALGVPGVRFLLDPLWRKKRGTDFIRTVPLSALPAGKPVRAEIVADRWDAYTHYPPGPIGAVWLIRTSDTKDVDHVRCLQSICPHLGCGIDFVAGAQVFRCPCHASDFSIDGTVLKGPSPRPMDELRCRVTQEDEQDQRWVEVRYEEFQPGTPSPNSSRGG